MTANIAQFLEKLKLNLFTEDGFKDAVCEVIYEKTTFPIKKEYVKEMRGLIVTKVDSYMKMEILMKKVEILNALRSRYPKRMIKDII